MSRLNNLEAKADRLDRLAEVDQIHLQAKMDRLEKEKLDLKQTVEQLKSLNNNRPAKAAGRTVAPQSCRDLASSRHSLDGFYQVQSATNLKKMATVFCDFSGGSPGLKNHWNFKI